MSQAQIGNLQVQLGINTAQFEAGVRAAQGQLSSLGNSLKAFATGAAAIGLFQSAVTALKDVAELGDVAESIGLSAEQLQVFQKMALASGTSTDVLVRGLQSIAEQSTDTKSKLAQLFDANGLALAGKSMNQVILEFMDLLKNARTPAEQLAMATEVLGTKVGRQLVEALRSGSEGWQEAFALMQQSGNYLGNESVKEAQRIETAYNQAMTNIATAWQRMVVGMVSSAASLAKALDPIINPDFSKSTAGGELWRFLTGQNVDWNFGKAPPEFSNAPTVNMGPMGGAGQFPKVPVKMTVLPADPAEKEKIRAEVQKTIDGATYVAPDSIDAIYGAGEAFTDLWARMQEGMPTTSLVGEAFQNIADTITSTLGNALAGLINGTMSVKDAFKSMAQSISQQLSELAAQLIKSAIFKFISMGFGGMGGVTVGGMSFGGFYADGGHLGSGKWGIAGENGPEIIRGPANITPMDRMGAGSPQMNVTVINNSSAQVNTRQNSKGELEVLVEEIMADKALRGGNKFDTALQRGYGLRRAGR